MKRVSMWIMLCWICFACVLKAQQAAFRLDVSVEKASLEQFVRQLERESGYSFVYGEDVSLRQPITLSVKQQTVQEILEKAFEREPIGFRLEKNHILLFRRPLPKEKRYTICGYVTDRSSAETLIGANILEGIRHTGTYTNSFGFYTLTVPEGEVELNISYLGYDVQTVRFCLQKDTMIPVQLTANNRLEELLVLSDRKEAGIYATGMSSHDVPLTQIRNTPALLGEADLLKTIQLLPGVQAATEGFSGLYVRGGGPDQNLILLDGIPVYNADHLLGVFSIFTPEAMKRVTLYKGAFPARFGSRLSSVVDIRTNDGDMKQYHGTASLGLLTSKIHLEGPIWKDRTAFNVSVRRTYLDWLARPFLDKDKKYGYYFYDVNAKVNHKFSDRSRFFLSFYKGKDHCDYTRNTAYEYDYASYYYNDGMDLNWGNTIAAARWNYVFNHQLFFQATMAYNHYDMKMSTGYQNLDKVHQEEALYVYDSDYHSGIHDYSVQADFDYTPHPAHHLKLGTSYLYHVFQPEVMISRVKEEDLETVQRDTTYAAISNGDILGHEWSLYAEDDISLGRFRVNAGIHLSLFNTQGKNYFSAQPRLSARYGLTDEVAIKASFTQMAQYVHLLSSSTIALPTDLWVPVTKNIRPMRSDQYALGGYYTGIKGWEFSLETYYKNMFHVLEYQDGASFLASSSGWEDKVEMGDGRSMGVEFLAQKTSGKTTGWIAYTLAKSDRIFENGNINNGNRFPYKYDRRHNLNFCVNHTFNQQWDVGVSWVFNTGGTVTVAEQRMDVLYPDNNETAGTNYIPARNNFRLPSSHRLNVGVNYRKKARRGTHIWNVSVYNVYNAMTPNLVFMDKEVQEHSITLPSGKPYYWTEVKNHLKKVTLLPCIPSITYTFKF